MRPTAEARQSAGPQGAGVLPCERRTASTLWPSPARSRRSALVIRAIPASFLAVLCAEAALAHASQQSFVLLLPTGLYIAGGVASVVLTVLLVALLPDRAALAVFRPLTLGRSRGAAPSCWTSVAAFGLLAILLGLGISGPHDPTRNPLPLATWALWWVGIVTVQGTLVDVWRWINPWMGPYRLLCRATGARPLLRLPRRVGHWPALAGFATFAAVLVAHPSLGDPDALAPMIAAYWLANFLAMLVFGPKWLRRGEGLSVLMGNYATVALFGKRGGRWRAGLPGWQIAGRRAPGLSLAIFMLMMLAVGSFDGLHETFWWLGVLGINPLEYPGRSAVEGSSLGGLAASLLLLPVIFAVAIQMGVRLAGEPVHLGEAFRTLAPAILPIALGYHFAHYFPSFLVDAQYALRAASDPLSTGADLLDLGEFYVTTGFFNTRATVQAIWLAQAGSVVTGHVLAILLSHALAMRLFRSRRKAVLSQIPLASFMVLYTLFGLWLLASPRGA